MKSMNKRNRKFEPCVTNERGPNEVDLTQLIQTYRFVYITSRQIESQSKQPMQENDHNVKVSVKTNRGGHLEQQQIKLRQGGYRIHVEIMTPVS